MTDRHLIVAVALHPDGSQSSRIWTIPADHVDQALEHLGTPDATAHIPADVRAAAAPAIAEMRTGSILLGPVVTE
ncbi:hypothetical protein OOJ91_13830 [Micromonospora lupini]|uniref:hypothetical protein n=1 Tax=Micromonospora lupini TaxID=285679 RepID=UPI00224F322E|nr:hypothetical protein [Micromonospora lupini]MCX5066927.1 hypothetical protein [Micromonospora lupini]